MAAESRRRGPAHAERGSDPRPARREARSEGQAGGAACAPAAARRIAPAHLPHDPARAAGSGTVEGHQRPHRARAFDAGLHHAAGGETCDFLHGAAQRKQNDRCPVREHRHRVCAGSRSGRTPGRPGCGALRRRCVHPARGAQAPAGRSGQTHPGRRSAARRHVRRRSHADLRRASHLRGRARPTPSMRGTLSLLALAASAGLAMPDASAQAYREGTQVMPTEAESATALDAEPATRIIPLEISINGARAGSWVLMERAGTMYAQLDAFEEWRINRDLRAPAVVYRGETWYPLGSLPGYSARFNPAEQSLQLNFSPAAFATTRVGQPAAERPAVSRPLTTVFANYDLSYTRSDLRGISATNDVGALTELGVSGSVGVLTNTSVIRNIANDAGAAYTPGWRRLETTFTRDFPERNASLRLGDSTTRTGAWGRSVYFGGIQWGTNFSLSPGYITQPIPTIGGQSRAPSTVELYINDALRQTSQVPTGPFTIDNFPQITGSGQARIVVRDLLGRETVLVQDFFSSAALLRKGLSDYSFEAGAVRRNLGIDSANYGEGFASGLFRHGLNDSFTLETRAEASDRLRGGGAGLAVALPLGLLGQVAAAGSSEDVLGSGRDGLVSLEHWSLRHGFTLRAEAASREYRQVGQDEATLPYRRQWLASYTYARPELGHLGVGYGKIDTYDRGPISTYTANYSIRVFAQ